MRGLALLATAVVAVVAPASAQAAGSVYVTNVASPGIVRGFDYGSAGLLIPMAPASVGAANDTRHVAVTPDGRHLYATGVDGSGNGAVSIYDLSPSGVPSPNPGSPAAAGSGPFGLVVAPDGRSLYVANAGDPETVSQYDITPSGGLIPKSPAEVPLPGVGSRQMVLSPDGRHAYVMHQFSGISQWSIDEAGRLTPKTPHVVGSQTLTQGLAITPDGRSLYLPVAAENVIYQYDITADGTLAPKVPPTVPGSGQQYIAIAPDGRSVYVGNNNSSVNQFDVGSGGALVPKAPAFVVSPGTGTGFMAAAPDGRSLYVTGGQAGPPDANPTRTYQFDIDADGKLSQKSPSSATTSAGPATLGIAVRPAQAPTATFAADTATAGSATVFDATESRDPNGGSISRYDWDFGDGSSAPDGGATPAHVYGTPGNYTVTLRVTGTGGCNATVFTGQATLCNGAPATRARSVAVGAAPGGGGTGTPTEPVRPGFTVVSRRALSKGRVQLTLRPSVAGKFAATATMRRGRKRVTYGKGKATARTAGEVKLTIKPGAAGRAALRRTRSLRLSIKLAFTPASNTTPSSSTSATVRGTGRR